MLEHVSLCCRPPTIHGRTQLEFGFLPQLLTLLIAAFYISRLSDQAPSKITPSLGRSRVLTGFCVSLPNYAPKVVTPANLRSLFAFQEVQRMRPTVHDCFSCYIEMMSFTDDCSVETTIF
jgi:hypothetical protein